MVLDAVGEPLQARELAAPRPGPGQALLRVPGHQVVGEVLEVGPESERLTVGDRVGVPWLGWTCGECRYCTSRRENLCDRARFTGYDLDGGYAEWCVADERFC